MAYNSPHHVPYYPPQMMSQQQDQQRYMYQQQMPEYSRAMDQEQLRRLMTTPGAPTRMASSSRRSGDIMRSAVPENDALPSSPTSYVSPPGYAHPSGMPAGISRSTTVPPGFAPQNAHAMSSLTLPPIRGPAGVPMSPPMRNAPPDMRQPHMLPSTFNAASAQTPVPSATGYQQLPYGCLRTECGRRFAHRNELEQHERAHRNAEKPCACPYPGCTWRFDFPSDVKYHLKCHTNEKDFACDFPDCGRQYQRKHDLFRHVRDKHPGHKVPGYD